MIREGIEMNHTQTFLGHPRGLATLFFTEFFERFSYYGMRALLVLFLTAPLASGGLGVESKTAGAIYGIYAGAVYLFSLPGGWLADRLFGQQRMILVGGAFIALGNLLLSVPSATVFYCGLVAIVIGTGCLKPNISAVVGELYKHDTDARRDAGFSIFYMGINLGATIAPLVSGTIGETFSYRLGFATAGAAMLLGLVQFRWTAHHLHGAGMSPAISEPQEKSRNLKIFGIATVAAVIALGLAISGVWSINPNQLATVMGQWMVALAVVFFAGILLFGNLTLDERKRIYVVIAFVIASMLFWAGFEQAGSTLNFFARDLTDRSLMGSWFSNGEHPASWYQSINPIFIIVLSPVFAALWIRLGAKRLDPSAPVKMAIGLMLLGFGFAILMLASQLIVHQGGKAGPQWLLFAYLFHTCGELCLSPIGLSNMTKLAPQRFAGQIMGTWFLGTAIGNLIAGLVGGEIASDVSAMPDKFLQMTLIGGVSGLVMLLVSPLLKRWMGLGQNR
jgi:POT family proton-dependent oligopeptide transporter